MAIISTPSTSAASDIVKTKRFNSASIASISNSSFGSMCARSIIVLTSPVFSSRSATVSCAHMSVRRFYGRCWFRAGTIPCSTRRSTSAKGIRIARPSFTTVIVRCAIHLRTVTSAMWKRAAKSCTVRKLGLSSTVVFTAITRLKPLRNVPLAKTVSHFDFPLSSA
jgi:hypothetical protein